MVELLTTEETADTLGVSRRTVYRLMNEGALLSVLVKRRRLVPREAITRYVHHLEEEAELERPRLSTIHPHAG